MDQIFAAKAQKIITIIILVSIIGLVTMPLFPWMSYEHKTYNSDGERVSVTTYLSEEDIHTASKASGSSRETRNLDGDIGMIGLSLWLALIFGIIALIGITVYRAGGWGISIGSLLLLISVIVIVFAILALVYNGIFFGDVGNHERAVNKYLSEGEKYKEMFFYNYIPMIMSIILLIASLAYLAVIVPFSVRTLFPHRPGYPMQPYQPQTTLQQPYSPQPVPVKPPPAQQPPTKPTIIKCPKCGETLQVTSGIRPIEIICPRCGAKGVLK
ncbi:MAG: hypothetical protein L6265_02420 [Thermoplasmatales archaeon]|nr:hypothetical protein [Thermoplasmatales archaeon]